MLPAPRPVAPAPAAAAEPETTDVDDGQELILEELTREQVLDWRNRAAADHQLAFDHIDRYGDLPAKRLFTRAFVAQVQRLAGLGHLDLRLHHLGAGMSGGETSGVDLARVALRAAMEAARKNGNGRKRPKQKPRPVPSQSGILQAVPLRCHAARLRPSSGRAHP